MDKPQSDSAPTTTPASALQEKVRGDLQRLLAVQSGHFRYESGHHGATWLDLDLMLVEPARLQPLTLELATRIARYDVDFVVGPIVGGAFVAFQVALHLGAGFAFASPERNSEGMALFSISYPVADAFVDRLSGKRVAIVDDVVNAGSAIRGTYNSLLAVGAFPVVVGALLVMGKTVRAFMEDHALSLEALDHVANPIWRPEECPLCAVGMPLTGRDRASDSVR